MISAAATQERDNGLRQMWGVLRAYVEAHAEPFHSFTGALPYDLSLLATDTKTLPTGAMLAEMSTFARPETRPLVEAVIAVANLLEWQQGYDEVQVGSDYLARSGWCHLAGPDGPILMTGARLFLGYWGGGLDYPFHWHAAEELYLTLAGSAIFRAEGRADVRVGPGDSVHHASWQPHATQFGSKGFLALIAWRGADLSMKLEMETRK
ncbi:cupin domain-containing protein [Gemmobacter lutimaris]|uniref:Cupin domain-containing protein n=1 Tax=Gemmobacter lutimaris TaxID=2306023 RepID=A0A398BI68_9RHOB|nr:dimethylsulfonioproprionate lyase family protein [Gemmobacter lutimaris]RID90245.1 cupin domain-containing protein [Gemmobacter lutimaris]